MSTAEKLKMEMEDKSLYNTKSSAESEVHNKMYHNQLMNSWATEETGWYNKEVNARSRSLTHFSLDSYAMMEISRIRDRLLRTNARIERSMFRYFNRNQTMTLLSLAIVDFMCFCSMSIMAPFFPKEATEKGLSNTLSGFVFSFYALVMFVTSPIFGKILPLLGAKFLFISGITLTGTCNILFGLLEYVQDYTLFSTLCFVIRGFEAVGASAFSTASYVFVVHSFPEKISSVLGILETFVGLGLSVGPAIGGVLYSLGGFQLPFFVLGVAMIAVTPINVFLLPPVNDFVVGTGGGSILKLLKVPAVIITSIVIIVISSIWAFLDPTLEPHLREFNLSPEQIGLIFFLFSALYGISSPFWGWLTDKFNNHWSMMVIGMVFAAIALLILGPCPYIPILVNTIWSNLLALSILGIFVALALLPAFQGLLKSAIDGGCDDSLATYSLVAGVWSGMYSLGEVIGPSLGGYLLHNYGFGVCSTVMALITLLTAGLLSFAFLFLNFQSKSKRSNSYEFSDSGINESWKTDDHEGTPLLSSRSNLTQRSYIEKKVHYYERSRKYDYLVRFNRKWYKQLMDNSFS
uniref:Major facilitator superfamily (MFS) profile domain-containing protein n=4 Tax=Photinus pyralis TaxID=7054 RepID=A0A1Y1NFI9_PHOPY